MFPKMIHAKSFPLQLFLFSLQHKSLGAPSSLIVEKTSNVLLHLTVVNFRWGNIVANLEVEPSDTVLTGMKQIQKIRSFPL
jgi:hypothetical protein